MALSTMPLTTRPEELRLVLKYSERAHAGAHVPRFSPRFSPRFRPQTLPARRSRGLGTGPFLRLRGAACAGGSDCGRRCTQAPSRTQAGSLRLLQCPAAGTVTGSLRLTGIYRLPPAGPRRPLPLRAGVFTLLLVRRKRTQAPVLTQGTAPETAPRRRRDVGLVIEGDARPMV